MYLKKTIIKAGFEDKFKERPYISEQELDDMIDSDLELDAMLDDYLFSEEDEEDDDDEECPICNTIEDVDDLKKVVSMLIDYLDVELLYTPGVDSKLELIKRPTEVAPKKKASPKKVVKKVTKKRK